MNTNTTPNNTDAVLALIPFLERDAQGNPFYSKFYPFDAGDAGREGARALKSTFVEDNGYHTVRYGWVPRYVLRADAPELPGWDVVTSPVEGNVQSIHRDSRITFLRHSVAGAPV